MTDVKMSGLLARAGTPVKLPSKMGMKTRPSKRASPPSRAGSLHINTTLDPKYKTYGPLPVPMMPVRLGLWIILYHWHASLDSAITN